MISLSNTARYRCNKVPQRAVVDEFKQITKYL